MVCVCLCVYLLHTRSTIKVGTFLRSGDILRTFILKHGFRLELKIGFRSE